LGKPTAGAQLISPKRGCGGGLGHVTPKIFDISSKESSKLLERKTSFFKFANKTANIKYKKIISLQHRVRAIESHIQNSTNHFSGIM